MALRTVKFTLNGQVYDLTDAGNGTWAATITAPSTTSYNAESDHKYHGVVVATDDAGNATTVTVEDFSSLGLRVLETVKPTITVVSPTSGAYVINNNPTFTWDVTDSGSGIDISSISIKIDNSSTPITSGITTTAITGGYRCTYTPFGALADGSHTIKYNVSDNDGNAAIESTITITIDTVAPTLNVTSPTDNLVTNVGTVTVSGTTNDATSSPVTVTVNGSAVTVGSGGAFSTTVTLNEGSNTITVVATDSAGKITTVVRTVYYDSGAPVISAVTITPNPVNTGVSYTITVTVSDS